MAVPHKLQGQIAAIIANPLTKASRGKGLARRSGYNQIGKRDIEAAEMARAQGGEITPQARARSAVPRIGHAKAMGQNLAREPLDFAGQLPVDPRRGHLGRTDAGTEGRADHLPCLLLRRTRPYICASLP